MVEKNLDGVQDSSKRDFLFKLPLYGAGLAAIAKGTDLSAQTKPQRDDFHKPYIPGTNTVFEGNVTFYFDKLETDPITEETYSVQVPVDYHIKYKVLSPTEKKFDNAANLIEVYNTNSFGKPTYLRAKFFELDEEKRTTPKEFGELETKIAKLQEDIITNAETDTDDETNAGLLDQLKNLYGYKKEYLQSESSFRGSRIDRIDAITERDKNGSPKTGVIYVDGKGAEIQYYDTSKPWHVKSTSRLAWENTVSDSVKIADQVTEASFKDWLIFYNDIMMQVLEQIPDYLHDKMGPPQLNNRGRELPRYEPDLDNNTGPSNGQGNIYIRNLAE